MNRVENALARATDTKALRIGDGVLCQTAGLFRDMFAGRRPVIIADRTTYGIAGGRLQSYFLDAGLNPDTPFIFTDDDLHAEWRFVEMLDDRLASTDAVAVAVGSGTINDLTKLCSFRNGKRYMTVATAASMDGYTAFGASITYEGAKQTFSCPAPLAVVADTRIIASAPSHMTASGYADLLAKVPAGADWILADALGVEPLDEFAFSVVQDGLKDALADPEGARKGDMECVERLIEGLLLGGFAMQAHKSSRPASGADHQFSHLWNMEHHCMADGHVPSHGFQVSIGLLASTALYEQLLAEDMSALDVEECVRRWPSLQEAERRAEEMFRGTDFPTIGVTETAAKYVTSEQLREQLNILKNDWADIRRRIAEQIVPFSDAAARLAAVGAPVLPEQIGIARRRLRDSAIRAQHIRRRYTILDVAVRTCRLERWLDAVFGENGVWNIAREKCAETVV